MSAPASAPPQAPAPPASPKPAAAPRREKARRVLHSQIERRRREKINDRLISLRNTVPACCLMMSRLGHRMPLTGPLAPRYAALPDAPGPDAAVEHDNAPLPRARHKAPLLTNYDEELGLNKLDVLTHTVEYINELHSHIDALTATNGALASQDGAGAAAPPALAHSTPLARTPSMNRLSSASCPRIKEERTPDSCSYRHRRSVAEVLRPGAKAYETAHWSSADHEPAPVPRASTTTQSYIPPVPVAPTHAATRPSTSNASSYLPPPPPQRDTETAAPRRWSTAARDHTVHTSSQPPAPASAPVPAPRPRRQSSLTSLYGVDGVAYSSHTHGGLREAREVRPELGPGTPVLVAGTAGPPSGSVGSGSVASDVASAGGVITPPSADPSAPRRRSYRLPSPLSLPCAAAPVLAGPPSAPLAPGAAWTRYSATTAAAATGATKVQPADRPDQHHTTEPNYTHYACSQGGKYLPGPGPGAGPGPRSSVMPSLPALPSIRADRPLALPVDRHDVVSRPTSRRQTQKEDDAHLLMHLQRSLLSPPTYSARHSAHSYAHSYSTEYAPPPARSALWPSYKHDRSYDHIDQNDGHYGQAHADLERERGQGKRPRIESRW